MFDVRADKQWLTAAEAAAECLPGLPRTKRAINRLITDCPITTRARTGRGGGREFHWTDLPAEARTEYLKRYATALPATTTEQPGIRDRHFEAEARAAIVAAVKAFLAHRNLPVGEGVRKFCAAYVKRAAELQLEPWVYETVPQISTQRVAVWRRKFEAGGTKALLDGRGRPPGSSWIEDDEPLKRFIVATIVKWPHLSAVAVKEKHIEERLGRKDVPLRTLQVFLKNLKTKNRAAFDVLTNPDRGKSHFEPGFGSLSMNLTVPNELWEIDASPADVMCATPDGPRRYKITAIIDVFTRRARVVVSDQPRAAASQALLRRCIIEFGLPQVLKADNGKEYRNRAVERFCCDTDIAISWSRPFSPEQKGHVERFFKTLQHGLMELLPGYVGHDVAGRQAIENRKSFAHRFGEEAQLTFDVSLTPAQLQAEIDAWLTGTYEQREHSALGMSPAAKAALHEHQVKRLLNGSIRALDVLLFDVKDGYGIRVVGKRCVRVDGVFYVADELGAMTGEHVHVKIDPFDLSRAVIYSSDGSRFICVAFDRAALDGRALQSIAIAAKKNFHARNSRIRADVRAADREFSQLSPLRLAAVNGEQISPVAQPGMSTEGVPAIAAPAQNRTAGEGNVSEVAGSNPAGAAIHAENAEPRSIGMSSAPSAPPREISLSPESARAMFDASRPMLVEHARAQAAIEESKRVPQPIPLTEEDRAGALAFLESVTPRPRAVIAMAQCDGYVRPAFEDDDVGFYRWLAGNEAILDAQDRGEFLRLKNSHTFQLLLANTEARERAIA